jgi:hypothetical protein
MDKKFTRIFLIILMAFAVCAFVSFEDARESDAVYGRGEMLKQSQQELHIQHDMKQIVAHVRPLHTQTQAFADGGTSSPTMLSLTTGILRC